MALIGVNMNLKEYLFLHRISVNEFSEKTGYSRTHISSVMYGKLKPSKRMARYLEMMTNGEVKAEDIMRVYEEKRLEEAQEIMKKIEKKDSQE